MSNEEIDLSAALEDLTEAQQAAIKEFKADGLWTIGKSEEYEVQPNEEYLRWDWTASRFLQARSWNVAKARRMFQEHLKTRKRMEISKVIDNFAVTKDQAEAVRKYSPQFWLGTDDQGRPVYIQCFTHLDGKKLFEGISEETVLRAQAYTCETLIKDILPECSRRQKRPVRTTASLIDFRDVSYSQLWTARSFARTFLAFQEANYPAYLGVSYVINAPRTLEIVWTMAKRILPAETAAKVQIYGSDYADKLRIPKDHLPVCYGGTRGPEWEHAGAPDINAILLLSPEMHSSTRIRD